MAGIDLEPVRSQVEILRFVKRKQRELKRLEEQAREAVEAFMDSSDEGTLDDELAITWHRHKRRFLNQAGLKESAPKIYEEYIITQETRQFIVKED